MRSPDMAPTSPLVVISADTHIGPRLEADLRPYCPAKHLDAFDRFAASQKIPDAPYPPKHPNMSTAGHYDSDARLADYDFDGVAAGVIFHGSQNGEALPFVPNPFIAKILGQDTVPFDPEMTAVGHGIYNRWLVDFVARAPARHIGLAYLSMWDIEAATREVSWAAESGLRGVNLPALREGVIVEYNDRAWDPFWSACEEYGLPLVTHVGGAGSGRLSGPETMAIYAMEGGGWSARRAIWWMIFGGVFERHPKLKLVITETPGNWWPALAREMDSIHAMYAGGSLASEAFRLQVPRSPSAYLNENVYFGASFASPFEVEEAVANQVDSRLVWGSDYPHVEGTFLRPTTDDFPSVTRVALRRTFKNVPLDATRKMVGGNLIELYGLDRGELESIATRIDAVTPEELVSPLPKIPAGASTQAFRTSEVWT